MSAPDRRVVVVTGASGGLGSVIAKRFAEGGDRVLAGYHRGADRAHALVAELRSRDLDVEAIRLDLQDAGSVAAALAAAGPVDVLINNAAYRPIGPFLEITEAEWEAVLSVNVLGAVRCSRAVLPAMLERGWGRIVNISGLDALWGWGNRAHVTTSKAALMGLTRAIAVEFSHRGITANTLVPGSFDVPRDPAIYPDWETMRQYLVDRAPVRRQGDPEELAGWCWFLTTSPCDYVTGQDLHVNGGSYPLLRNPLLPDG